MFRYIVGQNFSVHRLAWAADVGAKDGTDTVRMIGSKGAKRSGWLLKIRLSALDVASVAGPMRR